MKLHFKLKTSQVITTDKGDDKVQREDWIVSATHISEAIINSQKHADSEKLRDFNIISVAGANLQEIHNDNSENRFKVVINWIMIDEEKGVEKKQKYNMLITAEDFAHAEKRLNEIQNGTVQDWEIFNISQSNITEIVEEN